MRNKCINPQEMVVPKGFAHGVLAEGGGNVLCVAAQTGTDSVGKLVGDDLATQFRAALKNVGSVLRQAGGTPENILRLTIFLTDKAEYIRQLEVVGKDYRTFMGKAFPAMTIVVVKELLEAGAKVAVEVTAVVSDKAGAGEFQHHGQGGHMGDAGLRRRPPPGRP
jgi:enamine deaminase RidA (YjgF/YER057c/UK114 family)